MQNAEFILVHLPTTEYTYCICVEYIVFHVSLPQQHTENHQQQHEEQKANEDHRNSNRDDDNCSRFCITTTTFCEYFINQ